jgi:hypothetical protein
VSMSSEVQSLKLWGFGTQWGVTIEITKKVDIQELGWEGKMLLWQAIVARSCHGCMPTRLPAQKYLNIKSQEVGKGGHRCGF